MEILKKKCKILDIHLIYYHLKNNIPFEKNSVAISFDDGFDVVNGQHPRVLRLLLRKKIHLQTAIILDTVLSFSKIWDKKIEEKIVWPKIKQTLNKLKPFVTYNETQAKLIMKEIFVND